MRVSPICLLTEMRRTRSWIIVFVTLERRKESSGRASTSMVVRGWHANLHDKQLGVPLQTKQ